MTSRIEEFRDRLNAIGDAYVSQASAAMATVQSDMIALQAAFKADMDADKDLYDAVGDGCLKVLDRKLKEAGLT